MQNVSENPTKLLLHACCGPCTLEPSRLLRAEGWQLHVFYANSNIHPVREYEHRLDTLRTWAESEGLPVTEGIYDANAWEDTAGRIGDAVWSEALARVAGAAHEPNAAGVGTPDSTLSVDHRAALAIEPAKRKARCRACYRLRFEEAARYAVEHGFDALGTTLSVSPYQYTDIIREELERAAAAKGLRAVFRDFRPHYDEATHRSLELGMYRQNYCGCRFSDIEAAAEREQRKAQRRAAKAQAAAEHAEERAAAEAARLTNRAEKQAYADKQARKRAILKQLREQQDHQHD